MRNVALGLTLLLVLAGLVLFPRIDLIASGWFYRPNHGFHLQGFLLFSILHFLANFGARILGGVLLLFVIWAGVQRRKIFNLDAKAWLFLFLGLLLAPGLVANVVFKDHWGRARPHDVTEFGGHSVFSPALIPANQCDHNCSFVAGDASFGFYLPAIAYVVALPRSRRYFWGAMGIGALFGVARLVAGVHFLSDVIFAAFFVQITLALLYAAMYGASALRMRWRNWLFCKEKQGSMPGTLPAA